MKTFDVKLDVEKALYSPMQILFNVSGDDVDSVQLNFEFVQDDEPFDLTGFEIQLGTKKSSGKVVYQNIGIDNAVGGTATTLLSHNAYDEQGIQTCEIYLRGATETIVVSPFYFNSWASFMQTTEEVPPPSGDVYWQNILNKPLTYPPSEHLHEIPDVLGLQDALDSKANVGETGGGVPADHTHEIADVTGLQNALDSKSDINHIHTGYAPTVHSHTIAQVTGLQNALDGKVDDIEMTTKADLEHGHVIQDIDGLQDALNGKADDSDLVGKANVGDSYLKTETYNKTEVYNKTEINQMTMGDGGGAPVIVEDNLASTSTTNALSSNQGRILNETKAGIDHSHVMEDITGLGDVLGAKADVNHDHTSGDITDFATAVAGAIPVEYLTQTEGDGRYQAIGTVPAHDHPEYLEQSETDLLYQPIGTVPAHDHPEYLTSSDADTLFLTPTEGDGRYQAIGTVPAHTHDEYLTQVEGDGLYQPLGTVPAHDHPEYLTSTDADTLFLTPTEGDGRYQAIGTVPTHDHTSADITDFTTAVAGAIPTEYLTQTEGDTRYQANGVVPAHNHTVANITDFPTTMTPPLMQSGVRGGARVGNGLGMSGEYLTVKSGAGLVTSGTTYQVEVDRTTTDAWYVKNATGQNLTIWKGTQTAYDGLTKDPNTLYFIVG